MSYNQEFYRLYSDYLEEATVRRSHDFAFDVFRSQYGGRGNVIDLGCGLGEYEKYGDCDEYLGIDRVVSGRVCRFMRADYTDMSFVSRLPWQPDTFISLFSIEACYPAAERYQLYEKLFAALPSVQHALVPGFYYESRRQEATVGEAGRIVSWQTIEGLHDFPSATFSEERLVLHTPSKMFGQDVVEVWKFLSRR